eukprot:CAMPEP_0119429872 /NCGR_PEP_ID=MMETSP1335-20130426/43021_1 /TAXON_ID=259385 /ORGANISM="Chrysoculter rhomboideus, Strain RCC1486" /LENGTH=173 /DNA_ID=CAMNT_0007455611 /DNA_START=27 /DNA_END=548 /DNA_ORIENTATION=+
MYGAIVIQVLKDADGDAEQTSTQLEKMGYNIGMRMIDEFLAKSNVTSCRDFKETGEVIAKVAFRMFLGVTAECHHSAPTVSPPADGSPQASSDAAFRLVFVENPLSEFVELPEHCSNLAFSNLLCGVIRGALEMVGMRVSCRLVKDTLWGDEHTEISVVLKEVIAEHYQDDED